VSANAPAAQPANLVAIARVIRHMTTTTRIVASAIALLTLLPAAGAQASSPPPPQPLKPLEVKWILPPRTSPFYESEKAHAEAAGYETVEHDGRP
jgi:ABC-type sugar transport system substrate-binding protein